MPNPVALLLVANLIHRDAGVSARLAPLADWPPRRAFHEMTMVVVASTLGVDGVVARRIGLRIEGVGSGKRE
jgi:hypothetical protein